MIVIGSCVPGTETTSFRLPGERMTRELFPGALVRVDDEDCSVWDDHGLGLVIAARRPEKLNFSNRQNMVCSSSSTADVDFPHITLDDQVDYLVFWSRIPRLYSSSRGRPTLSFWRGGWLTSI